MPIGNVSRDTAPKRDNYRPPWVKSKETETAPAWTQRKLKPVESTKAAAPVEEVAPAPVVKTLKRKSYIFFCKDAKLKCWQQFGNILYYTWLQLIIMANSEWKIEIINNNYAHINQSWYFIFNYTWWWWWIICILHTYFTLNYGDKSVMYEMLLTCSKCTLFVDNLKSKSLKKTPFFL